MLFQCWSDHGLVINPARCEIGKSEVDFLSHTISAVGIHPSFQFPKRRKHCTSSLASSFTITALSPGALRSFSLYTWCWECGWTRWVNWFIIDGHVSLSLKLRLHTCMDTKTIASAFLCFSPLFCCSWYSPLVHLLFASPLYSPLIRQWRQWTFVNIYLDFVPVNIQQCLLSLSRIIVKYTNSGSQKAILWGSEKNWRFNYTTNSEW